MTASAATIQSAKDILARVNASASWRVVEAGVDTATAAAAVVEDEMGVDTEEEEEDAEGRRMSCRDVSWGTGSCAGGGGCCVAFRF